MLENLNSSKLNIDTILPFGDNLRPLLASSSLTDSDLKSFLAIKGIFISTSDRERTLPLITMSLLSPLEFEELREKQKDKESVFKRRTRELEWNSKETLLKALKPLKIPLNSLIPKKLKCYEIRNINNFKPVSGNPNHLSLNYEIERTNRTKDWATQYSIHMGIIELKLSENLNDLKIIMDHTAEETHEVNEKLVEYLRGYLLNNNFISNKKIKGIKFNDFNNSKRVIFFLNLLNTSLDDSKTFEFNQITNVEISIDINSTLPDNIKWMEDKIDNMKFKGKAIHETDLLQDPNYHEALILSSVRATFEFKSIASIGSCTFEFGFPARGNIPQPETEFIYKLVNLNYKSKNKSQKKVEGFLYAKFDEFKTKAYNVTLF